MTTAVRRLAPLLSPVALAVAPVALAVPPLGPAEVDFTVGPDLHARFKGPAGWAKRQRGQNETCWESPIAGHVSICTHPVGTLGRTATEILDESVYGIGCSNRQDGPTDSSRTSRLCQVTVGPRVELRLWSVAIVPGADTALITAVHTDGPTTEAMTNLILDTIDAPVAWYRQLPPGPLPANVPLPTNLTWFTPTAAPTPLGTALVEAARAYHNGFSGVIGAPRSDVTGERQTTLTVPGARLVSLLEESFGGATRYRMVARFGTYTRADEAERAYRALIDAVLTAGVPGVDTMTPESRVPNQRRMVFGSASMAPTDAMHQVVLIHTPASAASPERWDAMLMTGAL